MGNSGSGSGSPVSRSEDFGDSAEVRETGRFAHNPSADSPTLTGSLGSESGWEEPVYPAGNRLRHLEEIFAALSGAERLDFLVRELDKEEKANAGRPDHMSGPLMFLLLQLGTHLGFWLPLGDDERALRDSRRFLERWVAGAEAKRVELVAGQPPPAIISSWQTIIAQINLGALDGLFCLCFIYLYEYSSLKFALISTYCVPVPLFPGPTLLRVCHPFAQRSRGCS